MAIEPVVYRVTDARYLNELLFRMEMRMVGSDAVWKKVLQYRASHRLFLAPLETLLRAPCYFTMTEAISQKVEQGERMLRRFAESLEAGSEELRRHALGRSLSAVNAFEECEMSPLAIKSVLNGTYRGNEDFHEPLLRYHAYLLELFSSRGEEALPDEDFLGEALARMEGVEELSSYYRSRDFDQRPSRLWRFSPSADFEYCPMDRIEEAMGNLFQSLRNESPLLVKALSVLFFVSWLQPFDSHNDSLAALSAKRLLASEMGPGAYLLPVEPFLQDLRLDSNRTNVLLETRRSGDLTYLLEPFLQRLSRETKDFEALEKSLAREAREEPAAPEEVAPEEPALPDEEGEAFEEPAETAPERKEEEEVPVLEEEEEEVLPIPAKEAPRPPRKETLPEPRRSAPLPGAKPRLSEKETREYAQYLMETDPELSRKQASFLASHLEEGHHYTIQQFKKFARCSYETARTSMDRLARAGYYRKGQVKNKFVYTPIAKGERQ